ncbi:alpha/beta hydrolase [Mucilaginibacter paludis]|uniref:Alpha/beta hydrolase fold containing protein n=1 Tax=Mucilaginibacter paludis DSM 18603 TaxID=714943 RepID=H1Y9F7_9SPHI|nr:alpha/beta fold hydrolase [Mucilaginibacter paludis]EHQ29962.1 alpha/beta hydrolase fold containing protein [Mucilaginibacter paludis DSM 18603]
MIKSAFYFFLFFIATASYAQTEQPNYKTAIAKFKQYYNNKQPDSLFNTFAPAVKTGLPLDKTKDLFTQMQAQLGPLKQTTFIKYIQTAGVYKADYEKETLLINLSLNKANQIDGIYFNQYKPETATAAAATEKPKATEAAAIPAVAAAELPAMDASLTESPITLKTLGGTLSGTLTMPKNLTGKIPVVLIIAGSGPTDRNCNSTQGMHTNTYFYIAEALGKAGIATLRYDKRGVGQSTSSAKEIDTKFTDMVDDASGLLSMLKEDQRFSKFIIMGHSEGSLIGMITAYSEPINALISVAGPGVPADQTLIEQMKSQPPAVSQEFKNIIDSLKKGKKTPRVDPSLYFIARPSIQPYLMSWIPYDPARIIKKIKTPILIIQGTTDLQVGVADAEKLKKAKSEAVLKIIDGMNHILKAAPADKDKNKATYNDPSLPLKPEFVTDVVDFIKGLK